MVQAALRRRRGTVSAQVRRTAPGARLAHTSLVGQQQTPPPAPLPLPQLQPFVQPQQQVRPVEMHPKAVMLSSEPQQMHGQEQQHEQEQQQQPQLRQEQQCARLQPVPNFGAQLKDPASVMLTAQLVHHASLQLMTDSNDYSGQLHQITLQDLHAREQAVEQQETPEQRTRRLQCQQIASSINAANAKTFRFVQSRATGSPSAASIGWQEIRNQLLVQLLTSGGRDVVESPLRIGDAAITPARSGAKRGGGGGWRSSSTRSRRRSSAGTTSFSAFLGGEGGAGARANTRILSPDWVANHYRWVVWKLASMENRFPRTCGGGHWLHPARVKEQLVHRWDREYCQGERSCLKKIYEADASSKRFMVLLVAQVHIPPPSPTGDNDLAAASQQPGLELTDGWYSVGTKLDAELCRLVRAGRVKAGDKICIQNAHWRSSGGGSSISYSGMNPLESACNSIDPKDKPQPSLELSANSCRPATWDARLGFQSLRSFPVPLASLSQNGGAVGHVRLVLARVFPVQYMERVCAGGRNRAVFRDQVGEDIAREYHRSKMLERQQQLQQDLHTSHVRGKGPWIDSQTTRMEQVLKYIGDSQVRDKIRKSINDGSGSSPLTDAELRAVERAMEVSRQQEEIRRDERPFGGVSRSSISSSGTNNNKNGGDGLCLPEIRDVSPMVRIAALEPKTATVVELVIWGMTESQREDLTEGAVMVCQTLNVRRPGRYLTRHSLPGVTKSAPVSLSMDGKKSTWRIIKHPKSVSSALSALPSASTLSLVSLSGFCPRRFMSVRELSSLPRGRLVDVVAVVVHAPELPAQSSVSCAGDDVPMFVADASGTLAAVLFPGPRTESGGRGERGGQRATERVGLLDSYTVQSAVRSGARRDNVVSMHNLVYNGFDKVHGVHRLRWIPEQSGIGKISLLRASVAPARHAVRVLQAWCRTAEGRGTLEPIQRRVAALLGGDHSGGRGDTLEQTLSSDLASSSASSAPSASSSSSTPCAHLPYLVGTALELGFRQKAKDVCALRMATFATSGVSCDASHHVVVLRQRAVPTTVWSFIQATRAALSHDIRMEAVSSPTAMDDEEAPGPWPMDAVTGWSWHRPLADLLRMRVKVHLAGRWTPSRDDVYSSDVESEDTGAVEEGAEDGAVVNESGRVGVVRKREGATADCSGIMKTTASGRPADKKRRVMMASPSAEAMTTTSFQIGASRVRRWFSGTAPFKEASALPAWWTGERLRVEPVLHAIHHLLEHSRRGQHGGGLGGQVEGTGEIRR